MATNLRNGLIFAVLIGLTCMISILSRMPGTLAVFWPANALALGLLLRNPKLARPPVWIGIAAGYLAADLLTGAGLVKAVLLNSANMVGVLAGFHIFRWNRAVDLGLTRGSSVGWVMAIGAVAAASAGMVGGIAYQVLFGGTWWSGWLEWFAYELVNYTVILPLVLSFPAVSHLRDFLSAAPSVRRARCRVLLRRVMVPAGLLVVSLAPAWLMGGLGALAFTTPALIAAALLGDVFITTLFIAVSFAWSITLSVFPANAGPLQQPVPISLSTLIGLALLAGGPLVIASITAESRQVHRALHLAMTRDDLTGALRRGEFVRRAESALHEMSSAARPSALLMIDLDYFKRLNDTFGHARGDQSLTEFAAIAHRCSPDDALLARMGGEEFALLIPGVGAHEAAAVAEQIRARQQQTARQWFGESIGTASIGLAVCDTSDSTLSSLLASADKALYRAKDAGRNTIVVRDVSHNGS